MIRVLIVDDDHFSAAGLQELLARNADIEVTGLARTGEEALVLLEAQLPDVLVLDVKLPGMDGLEVLEEVRARGWPVGVLVFSAHSDVETVEQMLVAGADGYYVKGGRGGPENFLEALWSVARGERWLSPILPRVLADQQTTGDRLTPRQVDILRFVEQGLTNQSIAQELGMKKRTVDFHMERILQRLGAGNRTEAIAIARKRGFLS